MERQSLRDRYLRDDWPIRLGNLASTLARISSRAGDARYDAAIPDLLREGALFIEWGASHTPRHVVRELAPMQRELCLWRSLWPLEAARPLLALRARIMADRVLELSGLLEESEKE